MSFLEGAITVPFGLLTVFFLQHPITVPFGLLAVFFLPYKPLQANS